MRKAIYPGSFDPFTNGHLSIVRRARKIFDEVIVAVLINPQKKIFFPLDERLAMIKDSLKKYSNVKVISFNSLLVDIAVKMRAYVIIRGLRALSDFEYEFQMALMNKKLNRKVEVIFLMPSSKYIYLSSSVVREIVSFGGNVKGLVPPCIEKELKKKYSEEGRLSVSSK